MKLASLAWAMALPLASSAAGASPATIRATLHAASVTLTSPGCAGVVAESEQLVVTARHCVQGEGQRVSLRFANGATRPAWVIGIDEAADQAVLFVPDPAGVPPLELVRRTQIAGTVLYFEGNPDRPRFQSARLDHIGRCPSLPALPNALFTSIQGVPGDSGAPLVDGAARVVGLVHGGARCHIATPADSLGRLIDRILERGPARITLPREPSFRLPSRGEASV